ncbi:MAG: hypothetical protein V4712_15255 [Pseudomonadota bacterium]
MAIRTDVKSDIYGSSAVGAYAAPFASARDGKLHRVSGRVSCLITDNTGSRFLLCQIPTSAIILSNSFIRTDNWGFAQAVVGTIGLTTGLLNVAKATGAAVGNQLVTMFGAKQNQPAWQQAGLAAAPVMAPFLDIFAFGIADATVAGTMDFDITYANHF